jgi:hypothetical protein
MSTLTKKEIVNLIKGDKINLSQNSINFKFNQIQLILESAGIFIFQKLGNTTTKGERL